jgi:hypothetical protein
MICMPMESYPNANGISANYVCIKVKKGKLRLKSAKKTTDLTVVDNLPLK